MKIILIVVGVAVVVGSAVYFLNHDSGEQYQREEEKNEDVVSLVDESEEMVSEREKENNEPYEVIGSSVEGREIQAYRFGDGEKTLIYVGAIHGGYEWNSALLAYELIDYLDTNPDAIPSDIEVVVIPVANPDGLELVVGTSTRFAPEDAPQFNFANDVSPEDIVVKGRFNAHNVDLNRNFDCKWKPEATWREYSVGAGTAPFSEPEAAALRDFFLKETPEAVVFYHSASRGVYTSFCEGDALPGTEALLSAYSSATGYPRYDDYEYYEVTGDVADWLSTVGIPAVSVELSTHDVIEWEKNRAGIEAMFELYSKVE